MKTCRKGTQVYQKTEDFAQTYGLVTFVIPPQVEKVLRNTSGKLGRADVKTNVLHCNKKDLVISSLFKVNANN